MQGRFAQDELPLAKREAALAEVAGLPIPEGERRLLHQLGLAALDAGVASIDRIGVRRVALAEALGVAPGTVSRQAGRLVERGLVERIPVGRERAWAIVWPAVWSYVPVELGARPPARKSRHVPETVFGETPAERVSESHWRSQWHTTEARDLGRTRQAALVATCARVALAVLWPLAVVARRVCAVEQSLSGCARALPERTRADGVRVTPDRAHAERSRGARVQLALPFAAEIAGETCARRAPVTASRDVDSAQPRQLAQEAKEQQPAAAAGWGQAFRVKPSELETYPGVQSLFERCRKLGWVSPEEVWEFHAWANCVRRRSSGKLGNGETAIRSAGGYAARILAAGTWRDDVRREDRDWVRGEREKAGHANLVAVG